MAILFLFTISCSITTMVLAALSAGVGSSFSIEFIPTTIEDDYGELFDANQETFNKNAVNTLLREISGDATSSVKNMAKVNELAINKTTAADMRAFDISKVSGEDITITLGGFKLTATYLETTQNGDVVLTLWLTGEPQENFLGDNIVDGRLLAAYGDPEFDFVKRINEIMPKNSVDSSLFGGLTQFIEQRDGYLLWLPSLEEVIGDSYDGFTYDGGTWGTSRSQRKNTRQEYLGTYGAYTWVSNHEVLGDKYCAYYTFCSEKDIELFYALYIAELTDSQTGRILPSASTSLVVRPAFRLNLTKVAESLI